jgi:hypothetical protein
MLHVWAGASSPRLCERLSAGEVVAHGRGRHPEVDDRNQTLQFVVAGPVEDVADADHPLRFRLQNSLPSQRCYQRRPGQGVQFTPALVANRGGVLRVPEPVFFSGDAYGVGRQRLDQLVQTQAKAAMALIQSVHGTFLRNDRVRGRQKKQKYEGSEFESPAND